MIVLFIILGGLCLGSFVNALVWRIHKQEEALETRKHQKSQNDLSILHGRSMCPNCHHKLSPKDLIPIISWIMLGGKCRYCHKSISWQYPIVEIVTAALFILSYAFWPYGFAAFGVLQFIIWLILLVGFMALIVYDLRWMILPDRITFVLIGLVFLQIIVEIIVFKDLSLMLTAIIGILTTSGLFYLLFQVSDGKWIGGGDVKLAIALGALVGGPYESLLLIFVASLLGTLVSIPLIIKKGRSHHIPFGPFLIVATMIVYLFAQQIIYWYQSLIFIA